MLVAVMVAITFVYNVIILGGLYTIIIVNILQYKLNHNFHKATIKTTTFFKPKLRRCMTSNDHNLECEKTIILYMHVDFI